MDQNFKQKDFSEVCVAFGKCAVIANDGDKGSIPFTPQHVAQR